MSKQKSICILPDRSRTPQLTKCSNGCLKITGANRHMHNLALISKLVLLSFNLFCMLWLLDYLRISGKYWNRGVQLQETLNLKLFRNFFVAFTEVDISLTSLMLVERSKLMKRSVCYQTFSEEDKPYDPTNLDNICYGKHFVIKHLQTKSHGIDMHILKKWICVLYGKVVYEEGRFKFDNRKPIWL